ncbi:MAG TPA: NrfD/PsrC family molybdoenzyme membrane anchor subunit [Nitrospirota bacterium]|nr:NrfD/PsrC family molybdoenzyme membrane anchor subunit [Nitrospirota bacterium]
MKEPQEIKKSPNTSELIKDMKESFRTSFLTDWYSTLTGFLSGSKSFYVMLAIGMVVIYAGAMGAFDAIRIGYRHAYGATREVTWGILISTYVFFVVTSTGLCIVSSIGHVFGVKDFMPIAKRAVFLSIVTIMAGFTIIAFEIENPFRMAIYNVLSPGLTSNIWWMGTLYGAYMFFMIVEFIFLHLENHKLATYAGLAGLISGIVAHSNLGAIFGMLHGREYWYGPYLPVYFIASALMSGCAAIIFFTWLGYKITSEKMDRPMIRSMEVVAKLCTLMIAIVLFMIIWKIITGFAGGPGKTEVLKAMLSGPYAINFWVFEMGLGLVIPFILFLTSRWSNLNTMFLATAMMMFGIFFMRYDLIVLGQIVPQFHELGVNEYKGLLHYLPSFHEILIVLMGIAMTMTTFVLGEKVFQGHKSEIH